MVNASLFSPASPHFFQPILPHSKSHLNIPVKFFSEHIEGKHEGKTVTLRSDALEETWKVKMEGQRLTRGWKEFVEAHVLGVGDIVIFRHERDMLFHVTALGPNRCEIQYTPSGSRRQEDEEESDEIGITLNHRWFSHLSASFTRVNGLIKPGNIILVDKKGAEWVMELKVEKINGYMYMYIMSRNGWRIFCGVNGVRAGESLTLELIRGGESPTLKFCSKMKQPPFEAEARAHKRAKWSHESRPKVEISEKTAEEGEPSHRTRASNKTNANQENLQDKQPGSVSDLLMTKVRHSVLSTITSIRRFREELKTKEQELEDSLQEINNLASSKK
ncbi:hypothetical protein N665_0286s0067 [Sinapis alba]|nr:hypothetical protein N665_0286s0067 [Sinapis alba]